MRVAGLPSRLFRRLGRLRESCRRWYRWELLIRARVRKEKAALDEARRRHEAQYAAEGEPLVCINIATWNRARLLTERTLPPILKQSYRKIRVLVVGDCCTDDTAGRIAKLGDPARLKAERSGPPGGARP